MNSRVLAISDLHAPYWHPDTVAFMKAIKNEYSPDRIIQIGDEVDSHSISFHTHDPDLMAPGHELRSAIHKLGSLYELFPNVDVMESNHGSLVFRKGKFIGLPNSVFKTYREILQAPAGWNWHQQLQIKLSNGQSCYFCHGKTANPLALSQSMGMNAAQGHYHEKFAVNYWASGSGLFWQLQLGCLINDESLAYAYNKVNLKRPIIGSAIILDGYPRLLPMICNWKNRWIGRLV